MSSTSHRIVIVEDRDVDDSQVHSGHQADTPLSQLEYVTPLHAEVQELLQLVNRSLMMKIASSIYPVYHS